MSGFIAMQREALDHPLLQDAERFRAWFWLIANAAWKPTTTRIKGETITLQRGELSFSQRFLAEKWGMSKSRVDRFLADLRAEGMIATRSKNGATAGHKAGQGQSIITICNYEKYQDPENGARGNSGATSGATAGQQRGKEEQGNKEPKGSSARERAPIECPEDVDPTVWRDFRKLRERQKAPITETALNAIRKEAGKAGWRMNDALTECVARSWRGFKAAWVVDDHHQRAPPSVTGPSFLDHQLQQHRA
ncbi:helix-turn-helix domain-containing protein [Pelagerythrobacter marinus]|uniref:helix-turn-helix domain-containing protein n=1 Tax=Pelagerythrobacter marinus TaxID=538382 RepID=UPI002AC9086E|nr:helix-turn-helix domain-containing protein [Pelagerythrobacter marinus]MEC9067829.1 helix-turn-helix domain-containing protein [Pseudomonadota bacterium]WPZ05643.1 helix-turn-helix domain-containing protein [Pelagerythrobacter marinus]